MVSWDTVLSIQKFSSHLVISSQLDDISSSNANKTGNNLYTRSMNTYFWKEIRELRYRPTCASFYEFSLTHKHADDKLNATLWLFLLLYSYLTGSTVREARSKWLHLIYASENISEKPLPKLSAWLSYFTAVHLYHQSWSSQSTVGKKKSACRFVAGILPVRCSYVQTRV